LSDTFVGVACSH